MSAEPKVTLVNIENNKTYIANGQPGADASDNLLDFSEVKAGDKSKVFKLRVWNNKSGDEICSTMKDTEVFAMDANKAKLEDIIVQGWLNVKCTTGINTSNVQLKANNTLKINGKTMQEGEISGATNDGNHETEETKKNYADLEFFAQIPAEFAPNATHGIKEFFLCIRYFFV